MCVLSWVVYYSTPGTRSVKPPIKVISSSENVKIDVNTNLNKSVIIDVLFSFYNDVQKVRRYIMLNKRKMKLHPDAFFNHPETERLEFDGYNTFVIRIGGCRVLVYVKGNRILFKTLSGCKIVDVDKLYDVFDSIFKFMRNLMLEKLEVKSLFTF